VYVEDGKIVIYTRTGGGNRDYYENEETCRDYFPEYFDGENDPSGPWNDDLRAIPGYVRDQDDDFDSTYAHFYFDVPAEFADAVKKIEDGTETPVEYWEKLLKTLAES